MSDRRHRALVLRGGTVIDGTGAPRFVADVRLEGERIAAVNLGSYFAGGIETEEQLDAALTGIREECCSDHRAANFRRAASPCKFR